MTDEQLHSIRSKVKHMIVLMMENRSFDHLLGASQIRGKLARSEDTGIIEGINLTHLPSNPDKNGIPVPFSVGAPYLITDVDPGHEFHDVMVQLTGTLNPSYNSSTGEYPTGLTNTGFVISYQHQKKEPSDHTLVMKGFSAAQLPVINQLASEFVVCDHWFSSLPGPTWPNRFFVHAASSGGLDDSPTMSDTIKAETFFGYDFDNGTVFKHLSKHRLNWAIYAGSHFPQSVALKEIRSNDIFELEDLKKDIQQSGFPAYTFIEPDYGHFLMGNYRFGNSQHPLDDVTSGEKLIKQVYETIRNSPIWEQTIFILTYDEHGGFYDHLIPPAEAVAPGDTNHHTKNHFNFKQYGVRVPAIIISPLIEKNLIDKQLYDHSSIAATLEKLFGLPPLTQRDAQANHFLDLITLTEPRDTPKALKNAVNSGVPNTPPSSTKELVSADQPQLSEAIDSSLAGFMHVANLRHLEVATPEQRTNLSSIATEIINRQSALNYMSHVKDKIAAPKPAGISLVLRGVISKIASLFYKKSK